MEKGLDGKIFCLDGVLEGDKYAGEPGAPGEESVGALAKGKGETLGEGCFGNVGRDWICMLWGNTFKIIIRLHENASSFSPARGLGSHMSRLTTACNNLVQVDSERLNGR